MRPIVSGIHELFQYIRAIKDAPEQFRPEQCPHCGRKGVRCHGHYDRKADRVNPANSTLNPIWIFRFYCSACKRTCSVLPECIPPRRWYLWKVQQAILLLCLSPVSQHQISQQFSPSRWTISRWHSRLVMRFNEYSSYLKSAFSWLGYTSGFIEFWQTCLSKCRLSTAMLRLNNSGVFIP